MVINYLLDRRQRVILPGVNSNKSKKIFAGVPQGSTLGPLLFLIFINDIVNGIGSCIRLFANTCLFIIIDDPVASAEQLDADLIKILQSAETWLVTFNPDKLNHPSSLEELTNLYTSNPLYEKYWKLTVTSTWVFFIHKMVLGITK